MAPANEIAARLLHQVECEIMHPVGVSGSQAGPFAGWTLAPAMQLYMPVVEVKPGVDVPANRTDAERNLSGINHAPFNRQRANRLVKIRVAGLPELRMRDGPGELQRFPAAGGDRLAFLQGQQGFAGAIEDVHPG